jgi:hypothetical protein
MRYHAKGPKFVLYQAYRRWVKGKLCHVGSGLRGAPPPFPLRDSHEQLDFGF